MAKKKKTEVALDEAVEKLESVETSEEVEAEAPAEEKETVIPEPAFVENGDTEVESFNHKSVTIKGKTYAIDRATHKALVAGDFSVLKDIKK